MTQSNVADQFRQRERACFAHSGAMKRARPEADESDRAETDADGETLAKRQLVVAAPAASGHDEIRIPVSFPPGATVVPFRAWLPLPAQSEWCKSAQSGGVSVQWVPGAARQAQKGAGCAKTAPCAAWGALLKLGALVIWTFVLLPTFGVSL